MLSAGQRQAALDEESNSVAKAKKDNRREHRINMEIIVDAYDEHERAMGWYCYLEE